MSYPMICIRHSLQTHCNQYVKTTDITVGDVLILQDLTTKAFIQNDRLLPEDALGFFCFVLFCKKKLDLYAKVNTQATVQLEIQIFFSSNITCFFSP